MYGEILLIDDHAVVLQLTTEKVGMILEHVFSFLGHLRQKHGLQTGTVNPLHPTLGEEPAVAVLEAAAADVVGGQVELRFFPGHCWSLTTACRSGCRERCVWYCWFGGRTPRRIVALQRKAQIYQICLVFCYGNGSDAMGDEKMQDIVSLNTRKAEW